MSTPFSQSVRTRLDQTISNNLLRTRRVVKSLGHGRCDIDGRVLWDLSSNDYHGFADHPEVAQAACDATDQAGIGARASQLISGYSPWHQQLVQQLCQFEQVEDALLCGTGYAACQGVLATLISADDVVFSERFNHASLIDGIRLSQGKLRVYRSEDLSRLEQALKKVGHISGHKWIVTETVFGMDGTLAPLSELIQLAEQYDAFLICDEAHATGVYGPQGQGMIAELRSRGELLPELIERRIPVRIGTLSKALGSQGGFILGSADVIQLLWNSTRTVMFSTGLAIPSCAAATAAIRLLDKEPDRCHELRNKATAFRQQLSKCDFQILGAEDCPIVPIVLNEPEVAIRWAQSLETAGFLVGAIRPPTVPQGTSRLRISVCSNHTEETLQELVTALDRNRSVSGYSH